MGCSAAFCRSPEPSPSSEPWTTTLRVGKEKPGSVNFYANIEGESTVFSLTPAVIANLQAELHDQTVLSFPADRIKLVLNRANSKVGMKPPLRRPSCP